MKILFDGYWWADGPPSNRTVMREIIAQWRNKYLEDELAIAVRKKHSALIGDLPRQIEVVQTRLWPQAASNAVELPALARKIDADYIVAHNYAPLGRRSLVFVHDVMFIDHPEWFSRSERAYFAVMPAMLRRASAVATSSSTEAARIVKRVGGVDQVTAVGLAVSSDLLESDPTRPADAPETFALIVGRLNVRKNLENAIKAALISERVTRDSPLLVVGDSGHSGRSDLSGEIAHAVDSGCVRFLGSVTNGELRWLYEHARVTLYVSLDEGFGLPPVEAASFGSPVVVSDLPVFRETMGDGAVFVDPHDPGSIAGHLDRAFESDKGRPKEHSAGQISARWSWDLVVTELRGLITGPDTATGREETV